MAAGGGGTKQVKVGYKIMCTVINTVILQNGDLPVKSQRQLDGDPETLEGSGRLLMKTQNLSPTFFTSYRLNHQLGENLPRQSLQRLTDEDKHIWTMCRSNNCFGYNSMTLLLSKNIIIKLQKMYKKNFRLCILKIKHI